MSIIGSNILAGASGQGGFTIEESLRFNASQSSYLSWTPASAGNRKTWTWSGWVKRGQLGTPATFFSDRLNDNNKLFIRFDSIDRLEILANTGGGTIVLRLRTDSVYRDPSAWYHIVAEVDTTQATASNRAKLYVNGEQVTALETSTYPSQNSDLNINNATEMALGRQQQGTPTGYLDGYLTEVNFIDGQALDPSSFGEFDSVTGVWKPAKYTGTYGTNGFYLPMKLDNTTEGFNTVTYIGNGSTQKISGVGFSPDLVWMKSRDTARSNVLQDTVRGTDKQLFSNLTNADNSLTNYITSFDSDGISIGDNNNINYNAEAFVAWCWDAGNTTVSNTDGSITSSVRANPAYGFSVVSYTGTGSAATVGHGLGVAPAMIITKARSTISGWTVYHSENTVEPATEYLRIDTTAATVDNINVWNGTEPTSSVFTVGTSTASNGSGVSLIAYCFSEVSGYSKFGSYTGTGATGNAVTTGFKPAFVMIKRTDLGDSWALFDSTRDSVNPIDTLLYAERSDAEGVNTFGAIDFTDTGFTVNGIGSTVNNSGGTYIYMAFADTREYAFWLDDSGNNNDWQPNGGITTNSTVTDTPTPYADGGNYCVLSPIDKTTNTIADLSNGNLKFEGSTSNSRTTWGTFTVNSQKWYFEVSIDFSAAAGSRVGLRGANSGICYRADGQKLENSTSTSYGATWAAGDLIGVAFDCDAQTIEFFKNNVSQGSFSYTNSVDSSNEVKAEVADGSAGNPLDGTANFGQRPFAYTLPDGFKALHTGNLPEPEIVDGGEYFNTVTYTGNGSTQSITGVGFQPDFVWGKIRSTSGYHRLHDVVRGSDNTLATNVTDNESIGNGIVSFDADGFTMDSGTNINQAYTYVAWNWKANGAGVSNTDGSITSTVSANPTAGFSIVTYTGTGANATVGHGLGVAPKMVIARTRDASVNWAVGHDRLPSWSYWLSLNTTNAQASNTNLWNGTTPTSSVFTIGSGGTTNASGDSHVAYCFSEVDGYSKFGSYTGNGSADGPFVYTGFRPAFVMVKRTNSTGNWAMSDNKREGYNKDNDPLYANLTNVEGTDDWVDFVANGFKLRASTGDFNTSGGTYIYMAFAENPFKNSLAR